MRYLGLSGVALIFGFFATASLAQDDKDVQRLPASLAPVETPDAPLQKPTAERVPLSVIAGLPQGFDAPDRPGALDAAALALHAGTGAARAKIELIRSAPVGKPDPGRYHIVYDAASPAAAPDWLAYRAGDLPETHPGFAVRRAEEARGLTPGSCLSVQSGEVFCGPVADRLRAMAKVSGPAQG